MYTSSPKARTLKSTVRSLLRSQARYRARAWALDTPIVSELFGALDPVLRAYCRPDRATDLLIDGFPRSANSYAAAAFRVANPGLDVRSNFHSHRSVLRAVRLGVPALVLIRDPREAIVSALQLNPAVGTRHAIRHYLAFYNGLRGRNGFVLADFKEVIGDFGEVLNRCNAYFGTSFAAYVGSAANEATVQQLLADWHRAAFAYAGLEPPPAAPRAVAAHGSDFFDRLDRRDVQALEQASELYRSMIEGRPLAG